MAQEDDQNFGPLVHNDEGRWFNEEIGGWDV